MAPQTQKMSQSSRESRIISQTRPRVLFPSQTQAHTQGPSQAKIKWYKIENSALVAFVQNEESGVKVMHKNVEYWNRAAAFVKQGSKLVYSTGKHFHYC